MIYLTATGRRATARTTEHLTTGSVGMPVTLVDVLRELSGPQ